MKALASIFVIIAILCSAAAVVCRIKLAPIVGLNAKSYLCVADTALLFAITFLVLEVAKKK